MPNDNWKNFERAVAKKYGGKRTGAMGSNELRESCDVITGDSIIECKLRKEWPTPKQIIDWHEKLMDRKPKDKHAFLCIKIGGCHGWWEVDCFGRDMVYMQHSSWVKYKG